MLTDADGVPLTLKSLSGSGGSGNKNVPWSESHRVPLNTVDQAAAEYSWSLNSNSNNNKSLLQSYLSPPVNQRAMASPQNLTPQQQQQQASAQLRPLSRQQQKSAPSPQPGGRLSSMSNGGHDEEDESSAAIVRSRTPNLIFLEGPKHHLRRKNLPARVDLRQRVMSTTPTLRLIPSDADRVEVSLLNARKSLMAMENPHPAAIEASLNEDLAKIDPSDNYRRLQTHRIAFERFIELQDVQSQTLLRRILKCYEEVELHQFSKHFDEVNKRLVASEQVAHDAIVERNNLRRHAEGLHLDITNLERQLHAREEMLAELAVSHKINLSNVNWIEGGGAADGVGGGTATSGRKSQQERGSSAMAGGRMMAEIRSIQERVAARHGEAVRTAAREEQTAAAAVREEESNELQRHEMDDAEALISRGGIEGLRGIPANEALLMRSASTSGGLPDASPSKTLQTVYIQSQRVDNLGVPLSPRGMPAFTITTLPGESPRRGTGAATAAVGAVSPFASPSL